MRRFTDTRVRFIQHKTNKGGAAARNTGIRNAHGKYIAFLDDDDEWLPEKLRLQVDLLDKSPAEVGGVYTAFTQVDKVSGDTIFRKTATKSGNLLHVLHCKNCIGTTSSVLLRRECLEKVGLFDENLQSLQDYDLWIRISRVFQFAGIDQPLLIYYVHHWMGLIAGALCTALAAGVVAVFFCLDSTHRQQFFLRLALFRKVIPV